MKIKKSIIILHGWGLKGDVYKYLSSLLTKAGFAVYAPDLPGFGDQPLVSQNMKLDDYVQFLKKFIAIHHIVTPFVIGHSFGGRIALKYEFMHPNSFSKLILTGVPIIRHMTLRKKIAFNLAILGGKIFQIFPFEMRNILRKLLYGSIGEWDYYRSGSLQGVFKNIIEEDLTQYVKKITIPTLFVWGERDTIVPISDFYKIKKLFSMAKFVSVKGAGHRLPYSNPKDFLESVKSFL